MQTLEVAIGLVAYFLLMSMIASAVVDLVESKVRKKGRNLLKAVRVACGGGESFTAALYAHPRVDVLYEGDHADTGTRTEDRSTVKELFCKWHSAKGLPAFIPNDTFARAFLETLADCKVEELGDLKALFAGERRPWRIQSEVTRLQLRKENEEREKTGDVPLRLAGVLVPQRIVSEELDDAYCLMRPIVIEADGDVDRTLELLADHFEKVNERCKGWYKRWVSQCLLVVGLIMAAGTNGDSVRIVGRLNADPALRESMLKLAESLEKQGVAGSQAGVAAVSEVKLQDKARPGAEETPAAVAGAQPASSREQILKDLRTSEAISGGWSADPVLDLSLWSFKGALGWLLKLLGLAATGAAISLGAPFWFHLLQSLLKLRSLFAGKGGAEEEGEKAPGVEEAKQQIEKIAQGKSSPMKASGCAEVKRAAEFARYSDWAYLTEAEFKARLGGGAAWTVRLLSKTEPKVDTQVFVLRSGPRLVLAFRGTEPKVPADIVTDVALGLEDCAWFGESGAQVHKGFVKALEAVWEELTKEWTPGEGREPVQLVEFCGHSLGGALALLAAVRFSAESVENRKRFGGVYTIGQPRVGNAAFAHMAAPLLGGRYARAVNNRDAVPRVPAHTTPGTLGDYVHFGSVHYFDAAGSLTIDPGWFYRFLDYTLPNEELKGARGASWISELKEAATDHNSADYASLYGAAICAV